MAARFQTRSVSLPTRSHPTTVKIDEELSKLRAFDPSSSAAAICIALSTLRDVYDSFNELLNMASTRQALSRRGKGKEEELFLNVSVKLLDTCEIAKDVISRLKEHVAALQSAIRRKRKGNSSYEASVSNYIQLRRRTRKDAKKLVAKLKQMENSYKLAADHDDEQNGQSSAVIRVLREVNEASSCVFQGLMVFLTTPVCGDRAKQSKWGVVSKVVMLRKVGCEGCGVNEVQAADVALLVGDDKREFGHNKELEAVESCFEEIESGLEGVFRRLIKSRASVLNIPSQ